MNTETDQKRPKPTRDGTVEDVVEFLRWIEDRGMMKRGTVQSRRSAVSQVIDTLPDIASERVEGLDVGHVVERFQNLASSQYSPASLKAYDTRFRASLAEYEAWLENPAGWSPDVQERRRRDQAKKKGASASSERTTNPGASSSSQPNDELIRYPFPIRSGMMAQLDLPADLTQAEASRVASFVKALAVQTGDDAETHS